MKVVIAGSRGIKDAARVSDAVAFAELPVTEVVSGAARGVDALGEEWAAARGIPVRRFPANWRAHGLRAGRMRNLEMAEYADALVAVWDGRSAGTKHMIEAMQARGKPTFVYRVIPS